MHIKPRPNSRSGIPAGVIYTKAQAAAFMGISQRTLDTWRKGNIIACIERPGYIRFLRADLEAFLERYRKEARGQSRHRPKPPDPVTTESSLTPPSA